MEDDIDSIEICSFCGNPIYTKRERYRKDIGQIFFHQDCYGKYIALSYDRYQEVI